MPTAQKRATLYALLREVSATEQTLARVWSWGNQALRQGTAQPSQLALVDVLADRLYAVQQELYRPIAQFIYALPANTRESVARAVPAPQRFPSLANGSSSTATPGIRTAGLGVAFLAALPPAVLFAGTVLAAIAIIGVLAAFCYQSELIGDFITSVIALRADAGDAERRLNAQQARYRDCLARAGATPQSCAADFPIPAPTRFFETQQENAGQPQWLVGLAAVGGLVAVGGLLYVGVRAYRAASPYRALSEALP
jgi:hypothetical protein